MFDKIRANYNTSVTIMQEVLALWHNLVTVQYKNSAKSE